MVYVFLADGFEETEALQTIDILRRCGLKVQTLSVTGRRVVEGAHGIVVKPARQRLSSFLEECKELKR